MRKKLSREPLNSRKLSEQNDVMIDASWFVLFFVRFSNLLSKSHAWENIRLQPKTICASNANESTSNTPSLESYVGITISFWRIFVSITAQLRRVLPSEFKPIKDRGSLNERCRRISERPAKVNRARERKIK